MCGIAGFFGLKVDPERAEWLGRAMCARIRHRGPDGGGVTQQEGVVLGMVRLAIVDVEHGAQPMFNEDRSIVIVYNGEIYNAPMLRRSLEREGVVFRTRSDTEVVLRLYERHPDDLERHLRGMWAFAIHDRRRATLVISRDRFGIKPLFLTEGGGVAAFGSELRALAPLRELPGTERFFRIDHGSAHAMLSWAYVPNDDTIYEGVKRLPPATRVEIDLRSGKRVMRRHYDLQPSRDAARVRSLGDACDLVDPLLRDAVKEHLESDVPVAGFLSGGIDSSLILGYATEHATKPPHAFTIGFREKRFDESTYAREVAERLGVPIHVETFDENRARESLDDAMAAYDEPFGDSSSLANYLLSKVVARTHKVALGGDGGDEVFAGYKKHQIIKLRERASRTPVLRSVARRALAALPGAANRSSRYGDVVRIARRVERSLAGSDALAYLHLSQVAALEVTRPLVTIAASAERFVAPIVDGFEAFHGSVLQRTLVSDIANVLPNAMLTKVDRASMACGLEARVPMLDHRVVEAGLGLPPEYTLLPRGKHVLRALFARRFGRRLSTRRKTGFDVPVDRWLNGPLRPRCSELLRSDASVFRILSPDVARTWPELLQRDPQVFWHVFALASWAQRELR